MLFTFTLNNENQFENKIRLVITFDKTAGWIEYFDIY